MTSAANSTSLKYANGMNTSSVVCCAVASIAIKAKSAPKMRIVHSRRRWSAGSASPVRISGQTLGDVGRELEAFRRVGKMKKNEVQSGAKKLDKGVYMGAMLGG